ncbi:MAG: extracellular solute-binding protein [Lachnospiraceae bacterium]|jgi:maltose-binding protein MalE|uniref:sugar ABC transporter substrate-binding protein n=1 Tax=Candidatus Merdisoma sp. JLR.KK006 TaxID=3112626 RepID=UPI002FF20681|nr:extracellular solute-binding protein [Lachnospiraceae bacterium]
MRHTLYRRAFAIICVILVFSQMVQVAASYHQEQQRIQEQGEPDEKTQLTLWYTDDKLNAYLVEAAGEFEKQHPVEITLQLVTAVDYIENINTASISDLGGPDLFVTSSELLEKARLAGLAVENDSFSERELQEAFPQKALDAATCGGKLMAYPFYFETCFLLYNKSYTSTAPATIDEILTYADNFEGGASTEKVESIFKWNVADIFFNFFFVANYVNLGGATGDNKAEVELSAEEIILCLEYYQSLNAFFAIDADEVTTDDVLQEFIDGKIVYTIAKTDAIARLDAAIAEGLVYQVQAEETEEGAEGEETEEAVPEEVPEDNGYFYGIAQVPDLTEELHTKGLSVTNSVAVNAYSREKDLAKEFAKYLTYDKVDSLYTMANKMPVKMGVSYANEEMELLIAQYEDSVEVPKITDLSNYWIEMEIVFSNIWRGNDVRTEIDGVNQSVQAQLQTEE